MTTSIPLLIQLTAGAGNLAFTTYRIPETTEEIKRKVGSENRIAPIVLIVLDLIRLVIAAVGTGGNILLISSKEQRERVENVKDPLSGEDKVEEQGDHHAHAGVKHTVQGVGNISIHRGVEQDNTKHNAARLDRARPFKKLAGQDQHNNAHEQEGKKSGIGAAIREELDV